MGARATGPDQMNKPTEKQREDYRMTNALCHALGEIKNRQWAVRKARRCAVDGTGNAARLDHELFKLSGESARVRAAFRNHASWLAMYGQRDANTD